MKRVCFWVMISIFSITFSCGSDKSNQTNVVPTKSNEKKEIYNSGKVIKIEGMEHLDKIISNAGDRLLVFDLYADWCGPCKILAPILEKIADEKKETVSIYKIDTDKHPEIAALFGVRGIPHVSFIKNLKAIDVMVGAYPKKSYIEAIERHSK